MSSIISNQVFFLRTTRTFPEEIKQLCVETNKAYVDTANAVNSRIIGIFPVNKPAITGENWFLSKNQKQQGLRQVYTFSGTAPIPHGIDLARIAQFTKAYGVFTDGTNWYGAIFGSNSAIPGQISFYITSSSIVILDGGATPTVTSGTIVLEWIGQP